jgi:hypothetical protein
LKSTAFGALASTVIVFALLATISIGGVNKSTAYVSTASNTNTLVFSYTIASGDMTTTGITATTAAGSKSTAFGALASTVIVFALLATAGAANCMALPVVSLPLIQILNLLKWY